MDSDFKILPLELSQNDKDFIELQNFYYKKLTEITKGIIPKENESN